MREAEARTLLIEKLSLTTKKLQHEQFGHSLKRRALWISSSCSSPVWRRTRGRDHGAERTADRAVIGAPQAGAPAAAGALARKRNVYPVLATYPCCGDNRLGKIGEDVTEMQEVVPR